MKKTAIVKIVCWSLVAVTLSAVLVVGVLRSGSLRFSSFTSGFEFNDSSDDGNYVSGKSAADANVVNKIEIEWISGSINITKSEGDKIEFSESASRELTEKTTMVSKIEGNQLTIKFTNSDRYSGLSNLNKTLDISVPKDLLELSIETVSGATKIKDITVDDFEISKVSGSLTAENLVANEVGFESVSGTTSLQGSFNSISGETVSGSVKITSAVCPKKIEVDSVSGSRTINIPENAGFTATSDGVSGSLNTDFEAQVSKKQIVYKNGSAKFTFEGFSGSTTINKVN